MNKLIHHYKILLLDKIKTFSLTRPPRPDFSKEEIGLITVEAMRSDGTGEPDYYETAIFSRIPAETAKKYHWISSYEEYQFLAALLFCKRFPEHPYSKSHKELAKEYSKEDALAFGNGSKKLKIVYNENISLYRFKLYYRYIANTLLLLFLILIIPIGVYFILVDKIGLNQREAIIYSIIFYAGWLIFAKFITLFDEFSFKIFKKDFDKKIKAKKK